MTRLNINLNTRAFIGAALFLALLVILVTSVMLFSLPHNTLIAIIHTLIGFTMLLVVLWHLTKNFKPLGQYLRLKNGHLRKFNYSLSLALALIGYLIASPFFNLSPAIEVYQLGQTLKASNKTLEEREHKYVELSANTTNALGQTLTIELKKGDYFLWPQYAIWLETLEGEFVQPLFVTSAIGTNNFTNKVAVIDPDVVFDSHLMVDAKVPAEELLVGEQSPDSKDSRMRPESLPVFLHKLGMKASNGYFVPTDNSLAVDGYSGATMMDNFIYHVQLENMLNGKYKVLVEINHSFDFNEYYSSDRFPEDEIYSGDGFSAQPSVVYQATIDFDNPDKLQQMQLVGHGHHSGQNGEIYEDVSELTTALALIERVLVTVTPSS